MNVCTRGNFNVQLHTHCSRYRKCYVSFHGTQSSCTMFSFSCSADQERDWPPCKVVFFGLATNTLNVRNNFSLTRVQQKMLRIFSWRSRCIAVPQETNTKFTEPEGAPRFLWSVMSQPTSGLPLLLSATCGTAYDVLMSPLFSGATQIFEIVKNFENNGSKSQGPR